MRSSLTSIGAFSVLAASTGAQASRTRASSPPETMATAQPSAMIRPARVGSLVRNSATYFVAVRPSPRPAKTPSMPTVLWTMPYWPKCSRPSSRAVMTDAAKFEPCDMTAPMRDHTAPLAKRPRRDSARHTPVMALAAPSHDLISAGIKSRSPTSQSQNNSSSPNSVWRTSSLLLPAVMLVVLVPLPVIPVVVVAVAHVFADLVQHQAHHVGAQVGQGRED